MGQRRIRLPRNKDRNRLEAKQTASIDAWRSPLSLSRFTICPAILGPVRLAVNLSSEEDGVQLEERLRSCPASGTLAGLTGSGKDVPVDIQQEGAYAPVVYLKERTWLLRAEKSCKARSILLFCKPFTPWARCTATASLSGSSKFPR